MKKAKGKQSFQPAGNNPHKAKGPLKLKSLPDWAPALLIFLFSTLLYFNTLWNQFAVDDGVVYTQNRYTKKGIEGIKDQLTHDAFEGYFGKQAAKLVSGGRYRPLSMITFSLEYELLRRLGGDKRGKLTDANGVLGEGDTFLCPAFSHAINIVLFSLTCLLLYWLFKIILPDKAQLNLFGTGIDIPFIAALLYAAHPLHVEAVANIKGRDEIMCMLFSLSALLAAIRYVQSGKWIHLLWGVLVFEAALFSKENAITFFAVIPLTFFFFTHARFKNYLATLGIYLIPIAIFLILRSTYTQAPITQKSSEILNDPFLLATPAQHYATVILTFLNYFRLLIWPNPLTTDYYYNQIPYVNFSDIRVLLSIAINTGLLVYVLRNQEKKSIPVYAILFFYITFSISSNVFFTVGSLMNDRLVFMSSAGFCLLAAWLLVHCQNLLPASKYLASFVFLILLLFYSVKTYTRNLDWKNDLVLFEKDVQTSPNSARMHKILASEFTHTALQTVDSAEKNRLLDSSIVHASESLRIYPTHAFGWIVLGDALQYRGRFNDAINAYQKADEYGQHLMYDAVLNLGKLYDETSQPLKSKASLFRSLQLDSSGAGAYFLLALECAKLDQPDSVTYWTRLATRKMPMGAEDYYLIGNAFGHIGHNAQQSIYYLSRAIEMNPKAEQYYSDLTTAYGVQGDYDKAIEISEKLLQINPNNASAYQSLAISYNNKNDLKKAAQYQLKYNELTKRSK